MSLQKLKTVALYILQALLAIGAIYAAIAILGGVFYLHDASKHAYADVRWEILTILKNEIILAGLGTSLLFGIGTVRTYQARNRAAEQK